MDSWRVALLGDGGVGKTALATRFTLNQTYDPTIEDAFRKHFLVDNKLCFLQVLDTAGQAGQGFLLVYDITSLLSFKRLEVLLQAVRRIKRQAFELANRLGCEIIETSARTAVNINAAFAHVVRVLRAGNMKPVVQQKNQNQCVIF
ncbi:P-loop containing nucleoside triphosphate hydrolase protein [Mycena olivaceomarginata]|nr:P-loop containing nucleoside triphosphate hydrolase protein [Mycena olivaceomarginata]